MKKNKLKNLRNFFLVSLLSLAVAGSLVGEQENSCRVKAAIGETGGDICRYFSTKLGVSAYKQTGLGWPLPRGKVACGITSVYMAIKYYKTIHNKTIDPKFTSVDYILENYLDTDPDPGANPSGYLKAAFPGQVVERDGGDISSNNWQVVKNQIDRKNPIILFTSLGSGGHIVLVTGYRAGINGQVQTIYFNDPSHGQTYEMLAGELQTKLLYDNNGRQSGGRKYKKYMYAEVN